MNRDIRATVASPYESLYRWAESGVLWSDRPGRLVANLPAAVRPLRVLDAGCGDGRNAVFLEERGYHLTGFDSSPAAMTSLHRRFERMGRPVLGDYRLANLSDVILVNPSPAFDLLLSYGLFHCLHPSERHEQHRRLQELVHHGGRVMFSALTSRIPLPDNHRTPGIVLADIDECLGLFDSEWTVERCSEDVVAESHPPVVDRHEHSVVWIVAKRRG